jgi:phosphatidylserine/phosphatidylglycerophosphate/cardiolipin synthase-like enzyme
MSLQEQTRLTPIFSPDTSETLILQAMQNATQSIYIQQLEMSLSWNGVESPFLVLLKEKAAEGLDVRLFLNDNPSYSSSAADIEAALNGTGIKVQLCSTDKSPFSAIHNKGMIIDNRTVLISSVNWNEVSVRDNREAAVLIDNPSAAAYFTAVYLQDWTMTQNQGTPQGAVWGDFKNIILIVVVVTVAVLFIAYDWRRRRW